jgi:hypothetical protein
VLLTAINPGLIGSSRTSLLWQHEPWIVALRERPSPSFGEATPCTGQDEPGACEVVVLAGYEVRGEIAGRPRLEECRRLGAELVEQVGELGSLDGVEERTGHLAAVRARGPRHR